MSSNKSKDIVVITDTSCLIILEKLSLLHVLGQVFGVVLTTPEIANEYGHKIPDWIIILSVRNKTLQQELALSVDPGEASAIALAHEIENKYLITDNMDARKLAIKLGIGVIGSLGVLIRAKEAGYIGIIAPIIEQIKLTNFRVSDELYKTVLSKAGNFNYSSPYTKARDHISC